MSEGTTQASTSDMIPHSLTFGREEDGKGDDGAEDDKGGVRGGERERERKGHEERPGEWIEGGNGEGGWGREMKEERKMRPEGRGRWRGVSNWGVDKIVSTMF